MTDRPLTIADWVKEDEPRPVCDLNKHKWIELRGNEEVRLFECAMCGVTLTVISEIRKA